MKHAKFKELQLDNEGLHTPSGFMALSDISTADFHRNTVAEPGTPGSQTASPAGVVGGAVIGGVVAGPVGAVAGGLVGSAIKTDLRRTGLKHDHLGDHLVQDDGPRVHHPGAGVRCRRRRGVRRRGPERGGASALGLSERA